MATVAISRTSASVVTGTEGAYFVATTHPELEDFCRSELRAEISRVVEDYYRDVDLGYLVGSEVIVETHDASPHFVYRSDARTVAIASISKAEPGELRSKFVELVQRWRMERGYTSFTADIIRCPSYREIVAMGKDALPLIFEQLRSEADHPDHWDFALSEITGCDPVPEKAYGYMNRIAACWLEWAERNGYGR